MDATNPATGKHIASYTEDDSSDVAQKLDAASDAFSDWRSRPLREREELLTAAGNILRSNKEKYAELMAREMGKPISQGRAEIEKCAWACDHYAEYASTYLAPEHHPSPSGTEVKTVHEPLGPVLAVMPWNYPFWQVIRFAAPYLTAGNVGLLKHASSVPGCAQALEDIFKEAGYPEHVFQTLMVGSSQVEEILEDDCVKAVTLTGSEQAGQAVAETAGKNLNKTVLELGGSDPFIVLDDADLDEAVQKGVVARNQNNGQSCIAAKRFIVHEAVYDEYVDRLVTTFQNQVVGDPLDSETDIGPQADPDLMATLHEQVRASVEAGATVLTGGEPMDRPGAFYPPTVLTNIPSGARVDEEETFGPVASVYKVQSERDAVALANDSRFGLGASIWTRDRQRGMRLARELEAGCVYINEITKSDPRIPFGGIEDSGYGRELSEAGIKEFVNRKTVWVE